MESVGAKKLQVNLVRKGNTKDAKYIVLEEDQLPGFTLKEAFKQAKNKFKQAKFNS